MLVVLFVIRDVSVSTTKQKTTLCRNLDRPTTYPGDAVHIGQ